VRSVLDERVAAMAAMAAAGDVRDRSSGATATAAVVTQPGARSPQTRPRALVNPGMM